MKLTYLGHAGFIAETAAEVVVIDPWLSPEGAFDMSWFQFPCNHHLLAPTVDLIKNTEKKVYVYISHHHQDHFDRDFLRQITACPVTLVIPNFRRKSLSDGIEALGFETVKLMEDNEKIPLQDGYLRVFVDDQELNRDSALLLNDSGFNFLDLNDCKIFDRVARITQDNGHIHVFTCQHSGAVWHPACYDYEIAQYQKIAKSKLAGKFRAVANAISTLRPDWYLPSAGPPCFLDPDLIHLNFQEITTFTKQDKIVSYVSDRVKDTKTRELNPGDIFDSQVLDFTHRAQNGITAAGLRPYIEAYAARCCEGIERLRKSTPGERCIDILDRLAQELRLKLDEFRVREDYDIRLVFGLLDLPDRFVSLDLRENRVTFVDRLPESKYFVLMAPAWEIERVLNRDVTWEDFCLTFRVKLSRSPDTYDTLLQGFFQAEIKDVGPLCDRILEIRNSTGRITVEAGGCRYEIDAHCPHQGGDLQYGWVEEDRYWVCPRHRWKYDLANGGRCISSNDSIHAQRSGHARKSGHAQKSGQKITKQA